MKSEDRSKLLAIVAGLALAILIGDRLILSPLISGWRERSKRVAELRQRVHQGSLLLEREKAIRDRWNSMRSNALSSEISVAENQLLEAFDRWSRESRVSVSSIQPQRSLRRDATSTLEYRAQAFGNLSNLVRFLYLIERDSVAVKIDSLEISQRDAEGRELNLILQVSGWLRPTGT